MSSSFIYSYKNRIENINQLTVPMTQSLNVSSRSSTISNCLSSSDTSSAIPFSSSQTKSSIDSQALPGCSRFEYSLTALRTAVGSIPCSMARSESLDGDERSGEFQTWRNKSFARVKSLGLLRYSNIKRKQNKYIIYAKEL